MALPGTMKYTLRLAALRSDGVLLERFSSRVVGLAFVCCGGWGYGLGV